MRLGSLFSGYGGLEMGVQAALGGTVAWHSEIDSGACKILAHRYPDVPNLGDITTVDWSAVELVDVLTGGFPCQDVSHAGKRAGLHGHTRTGLWSHMATAIETLRPSMVVAENVRGLLSASATSDLEPCPWCVGNDVRGALRALGAVLGTLADIGYDARWTGLRAADVGAPHGRFRVFIVAHPAGHAESVGRFGGETQPAGALVVTTGDGAGAPAADAAGVGRDEGRTEPAGQLGRPDAPLGGDTTPADTDRAGRETCGRRQGERDTGRRELVERGCTDWGQYGPAITRWEHVLGRPAPSPTEPGRTGQPRLSPAFVEWMMGLPEGWVTDVPGLTRNDQLKALGNGVVPQQAAAALRLLLDGATLGCAA